MTATAERPNVLLITTDQQRFDGLGINGPDLPLETPVLDELAAGGVNFKRAYTTCPSCIAARRSLLTGLHPVTHGLRGYADGLEWDPPFTLPGLLGQNGYQTQLIGKLHLFPQRKRYGYDHMIRSESMNDRWETPMQPVNDWADWMKQQHGDFHPCNIGQNGNGRVARPWDKDEKFHQSSWLADCAVDFLTKTRDPSCPFFLHLSFFAPHPPLIPPQAYFDKYFRRHDWQPSISEWTPEFKEIPKGIPPVSPTGPFALSEMQDAASGYWGLINHIDDRVQYVLQRFFEYGSDRTKEPTIIIFTTDHGEMLGDHHLWRKSLGYESSAHIPFFIAWRNMDLKQSISNELVSLEDVCATVLDLCGVDIPAELNNQLDSRSLAPILRGENETTRERLFGEHSGGSANHFVVEGDYKYMWFGHTQEEQLFNLTEDPKEQKDLSADTEKLAPFRDALEAHLKDRDDYTFKRDALKPCANSAPMALWGSKQDLIK